MSPHASIINTYRAVVTVPEDCYQRFAGSNDYENFSYSAAKGSTASGENRYSEVTAWAEFCTYDAAENFTNMWHNKILDWQSTIRSES